MGKLYTILFKVPELQRKILMTAMFLAIYRIGFYIPLPIVDQDKLKSWQEVQATSAAGKVFGTVAMFGGTSIGMSTIFGLGIMPYISASIIFQLLGSVIPIARSDDEGGRERPEADQRIHPLRDRAPLRGAERVLGPVHDESPDGGGSAPAPERLRRLALRLIMTAGTIFLMWIGEQIDEYGIGNGISLLIMAGILARMPLALEGAVGQRDSEAHARGGQVRDHDAGACWRACSSRWWSA